MGVLPLYLTSRFVCCRYPTFTDALRDIDDALTMIFLFSTLPQYRRLQVCPSSICFLPSAVYSSLLFTHTHTYIHKRSLSLSLSLFLSQAQVVHNCKRLCVEFMHFLIESRSLRKVSIIIYISPPGHHYDVMFPRCFCRSRVSITRLKYRGRPSRGLLLTPSLKR